MFFSTLHPVNSLDDYLEVEWKQGWDTGWAVKVEEGVVFPSFELSAFFT